MNVDDMFPQPLFETLIVGDKKICLVCGSGKATSVLRTTQKAIIPICKSCSSNWNFYGYAILKKINPKKLLQNMIAYKVLHWLEIQSLIKCYYDIKEFQIWSEKQKKFSR